MKGKGHNMFWVSVGRHRGTRIGYCALQVGGGKAAADLMAGSNWEYVY